VLNDKAQTRLVVGTILLVLTGPFVLPRIEWGTADMVWLVLWGAVIGLVTYPLAMLWARVTASRRGSANGH
jgi:hypothetical protein